MSKISFKFPRGQWFNFCLCPSEPAVISWYWYFQGCKVRDHVVHLEGGNDAEGNEDDKPAVKNAVYEDLLNHRAMITVPYEQSPLPSDEWVHMYPPAKNKENH